MFSLFDDDGLNENAGTSELRINEQDVEYEVSTSSQGEQEFENALMVDSEIDDEIENGQAMPDEGVSKVTQSIHISIYLSMNINTSMGTVGNATKITN